MFYNVIGDTMKKKRKIKKRLYVILTILVVSVIGIIALKNINNTNENNKDNSNDLPNKSEVSNDKKMSLIAVGDVLIHESVYKDAYSNGKYDFSKMFKRIKPILKNYDLKFCNQESIIGGSELGISGYPSFNSPDEIGDEIVRLGFNLISLANNHAMDKGVSAITYSNNYWKSKDVITSGSYLSSSERDNIKIYEQNGIKYAFLAYTTSLNGNTLPQSYLVNMYTDTKAKNDIEKIRDKVDVIIVSMHWGEEYTNTPTESEKQIAKYLSDLGVNLIIGHHPHVVQPVSYIGDTLVIYSLGNFISNQLSIGLNPGIGLMVGMDIVVDEDGVKFENLYEELILAYAENSTNFEVIPFSQLNNNLLNNYENIEKEYMNIVTSEVAYD